MAKSARLTKPDELVRFLRELLIAAGVGEAEAATMADVYVWANLRGVDSHGVSRVPRYLELFESGETNRAPGIQEVELQPPTTLMLEDEIDHVPKRVDGFERARLGDFGPRPQACSWEPNVRADTAAASPIMAGLGALLRATVPFHDGEIAEDRAPLPDDPKVLAEHVKSLCYFLDASDLGISEAVQRRDIGVRDIHLFS